MIDSFKFLTFCPTFVPGVMIVNDRIDYDENGLDRVELIVTCVDTGVPPRSATAQVFVTVNNINDNYPVFTQVGCYTWTFLFLDFLFVGFIKNFIYFVNEES